MIGPHEGKELELMLAGTKKLAMFYDIAGQSTPEEIIPEKAFENHVKDGHFTRIEQTIKSAKTGEKIRYVFFAVPGEEWRAHTIIRIKNETINGSRPHEALDDIIIGRLLDYSNVDVDFFVGNKAIITA